MVIFIDFVNISSNFLGKQTNNSDQGAMIMQVAHALCPCGQIENKCGSRKIYFRVCCYTSL